MEAINNINDSDNRNNELISANKLSSDGVPFFNA